MYEKTLNNKLDFTFASRYENNAGSEDDTIVTLMEIFYIIWKIFFKLSISDILYTFVIGKTSNLIN